MRGKWARLLALDDGEWHAKVTICFSFNRYIQGQLVCLNLHKAADEGKQQLVSGLNDSVHRLAKSFKTLENMSFNEGIA